MVEKVQSAVDPKAVMVISPVTSPANVMRNTPPGVSKIRLLTRGEKLEP